MELEKTSGSHLAKSEDIKPIAIRSAVGSYLLSEEGRRYVDFSMGWCVGNLGWSHPAIEDAIRNFNGPAYVSPHFEYRPWTELSTLLVEFAPGDLKKCFRATGGTEAVEIALQAARAFTGRDQFIGIEGAYHGNSIAAQGLVSDLPYFSWKKLQTPLTKDRLQELEDFLKSKDVAAIIMEPIIINLNVEVPEQEFMEGMQELCRKYGTLIIMDEVASGFGRTGKFFATEHFKLRPDIMCMAKALSAGGGAIGATLTTEDVGKSLEEKNFPYSTYGWHPLSVAAAIASVKFMKSNWSALSSNINAMNEYFRTRLETMNFAEKPKMSMMGLAISVEFSEEYGTKLADKAFQEGLIVSEGISLFPSLNIEFRAAKDGLDILESVAESL